MNEENSGLARSEAEHSLAFLLGAIDNGRASGGDEQREAAEQRVLEMIDATLKRMPIRRGEDQRELLSPAWLLMLARLGFRQYQGQAWGVVRSSRDEMGTDGGHEVRESGQHDRCMHHGRSRHSRGVLTVSQQACRQRYQADRRSSRQEDAARAGGSAGGKCGIIHVFCEWATERGKHQTD